VLVIIVEFTRENLHLEVGYGFKSEEVIDRLVAIHSQRQRFEVYRRPLPMGQSIVC